jgi:hypothetical protein
LCYWYNREASVEAAGTYAAEHVSVIAARPTTAAGSAAAAAAASGAQARTGTYGAQKVQ